MRKVLQSSPPSACVPPEPHGAPVPPASSANQGDALVAFEPQGCIRNIHVVHALYLSGKLSESKCRRIDKHLFHCVRCENAWDARTSQLEDAMRRRERSITAPIAVAPSAGADSAIAHQTQNPAQP